MRLCITDNGITNPVGTLIALKLRSELEGIDEIQGCPLLVMESEFPSGTCVDIESKLFLSLDFILSFGLFDHELKPVEIPFTGTNILYCKLFLQRDLSMPSVTAIGRRGIYLVCNSIDDIVEETCNIALHCLLQGSSEEKLLQD